MSILRREEFRTKSKSLRVCFSSWKMSFLVGRKQIILSRCFSSLNVGQQAKPHKPCVMFVFITFLILAINHYVSQQTGIRAQQNGIRV